MEPEILAALAPIPQLAGIDVDRLPVRCDWAA